jgi:hypothetical protein
MIRTFALILCLIPTWSWADGPLPNAPHIYVEGEASISQAPEYMTVRIRHEATDRSVEKAKAQVDGAVRGFLEACNQIPIQSSDIYSTMPMIGPAFEYHGQERVPTGTKVTRETTVTLRDLSKYSEFMAAVLASHVTSVGGVEMGVSRENELLSRAQSEALKDARARAERLAAASNRKLGAVYSISEFPLRREESYRLQPDRRMVAPSEGTVSTMPAIVLEPAEPFSPGLISATARVYVVYLFEQ